MIPKEKNRSDDLMVASQKIEAVSDQLLLIAEQLITISLMLKSTSESIKNANRPQKRSIGVWIEPID